MSGDSPAAARERSLRHSAANRPSVDDPAVRQLVRWIAPHARPTDLGGTMSLNLHLQPDDRVLRIHRPLASRSRLVALQRVRQALAERGLLVAVPLPWHGATLFQCGGRWAELEPYLSSERQEASPASYAWMFGAMGALSRTLASLDVAVPRPLVATYGPPSTLLSWLPATEAAVRHDPAASETARWVRRLIGRLRSRWVPASQLPVQLVHGDIRLANVRRAPGGQPVYFDFGFLARRPRIHELAYALAWIILRPDGRGAAETYAWETVSDLITAFESAAGARLNADERRALLAYTAAVPLYLASIACFVPDPVAHLRNETRLSFLRIAQWLLDHPGALP